MTAPRSRVAWRIAYVAMWIVIAAPALYQLGLLITAIAGRIGYPYDLEWMEGGMLHHAQRIRDGVGIYVPPSIDFIPYLYTPLYPSLIALLGGAFGVSYQVGRTISVLALLGIAAITMRRLTSRRDDHPRRGPAWAGVAFALGLFAAGYPITEGWYDLVRADSLFLLLITAGIASLPRWATTNRGIAGHAQVAAAAAILALAFFCKQTGIIYVVLGGGIVLVLNWRRLLVYVATAGVLGLGGTALLYRSSNHWFWTYVFEVHHAHDFSWDRFWRSFGNILWRATDSTHRYPVLGGPITIVVAVALLAVAVTWWKRRVLPGAARPLLLWSATFGVSVITGAIGWATQYAVFNAYMPALLHGALAAGAALSAITACARVWWGDRPRGELVVTGAGVAAALPLAIVCITARWNPAKYTPTSADVAAGDQLIERLRSIEGEVWMPSHPWYAYMAGKTPRVHRMGIVDVTTGHTARVEGLDAALRGHAFQAIVLDNGDLIGPRTKVGAIAQWYRPALKLPAYRGPCPRSWICRMVNGLPRDERPRVFTGYPTVPDQVWVPAIPAVPPPGAKAMFDFEEASWGKWRRSGAAWGHGPVLTALPGQDLVLGATGRRFATSMHGGDEATGRVELPAFALNATHLTLRLGGDTDPALRVELVVDGKPVEVVGVPLPGGDNLRTVTIPVPRELRTKIATLVLVDDSPTGHLDVDDIWTWAPKE